MVGELRRLREACQLERAVYDRRCADGAKRGHELADILFLTSDSSAHVAEVYGGQANITRRAPLWGLRAVQPVDKVWQCELTKPKEIKDIYENLVLKKPLLTVIEIMCTVNSQIQNLNYFWRPDELEERRRDFDKHVEGLYRGCRALLLEGLHILIENPHASKLWQHRLIQKLIREFNLTFVVGHMCAYGLKGDTGFIKKATGWLTDHPLVAEAVSKQCPGDHEHEIALGANSKRGQVYTEQLADSVCSAVREIARERGDSRYSTAWVAQTQFNWVADCPDDQWMPPGEGYPVAEVWYLDIDRTISEWVPVLDIAIDKLKGKSFKSADVKEGTPLYEQVKRLSPWKLAKVQIARDPRSRRLPMGTMGPVTHRAVVFKTATGTVIIESEPIAAMSGVNEWFKESVEAGIFIYGVAPARGIGEADRVADAPETAATPAPRTRSASSGPSAPPPGYWPDDVEAKPWEPGARDISFPGAPDNVVPPWIKAVLRRLHTNLGHPATASLVRQLAAAKASGPALLGARCLKCAVCDRTRPPREPRPGAIFKAKRFLDRLIMDVLFVYDIEGKTYSFLSLVDDATVLHVLVRVEHRTEDELLKALVQGWLRPYGSPDEILTDQESAFKGQKFTAAMDQLGVVVRFVPRGAHYQLGRGERQGFAAKWIMGRLINQHAPTTGEEMDLIAVMTTAAKNSMMRRSGSSPAQWAFGRNPKVPGGPSQ